MSSASKEVEAIIELGFSVLARNLVFLLALVAVHNMVPPLAEKSRTRNRVAQGLVVGFIGIVLMMVGFEAVPGTLFDGRAVLLGISGLFLGMVPTGIAVVITATFRLFTGGVGAIPGVLMIVGAAGLGLAWRRWRLPNEVNVRWQELLVFGLASQVITLGVIALLPAPAAGELFRAVGLPSILLFPGVTVLVGLLMIRNERERHHLESLRQSEQRFRRLLDEAPDAIIVQTEGKFTLVNKAALEFYGADSIDDLIGRPILNRLDPEYQEAGEQRIEKLLNEKCSTSPMEQVHRRLDGTPVSAEVSAAPITFEGKDGALVFLRDISERKRLETAQREMEASLREQQKMQAIGTLAGGVAHEINNPINGIMNYAQLIVDSVDAEQPEATFAREIIEECERVANITEQLLRFARHDHQSHSPARVGDIIERTLSLVRTLIRREQIRLDVSVEDDLPSIRCRAQQIQQVIMNLVMNARDALNSKYPGYHENKVIRLHVEQVERNADSWIKIQVEDRGVGIDDRIRDRIFEPFFTTKSRELGAGLGLTISYSIVNEHGGRLWYRSEAGEYTIFTIELPINPTEQRTRVVQMQPVEGNDLQ